MSSGNQSSGEASGASRRTLARIPSTTTQHSATSARSASLSTMAPSSLQRSNRRPPSSSSLMPSTNNMSRSTSSSASANTAETGPAQIRRFLQERAIQFDAATAALQRAKETHARVQHERDELQQAVQHVRMDYCQVQRQRHDVEYQVLQAQQQLAKLEQEAAEQAKQQEESTATEGSNDNENENPASSNNNKTSPALEQATVQLENWQLYLTTTAARHVTEQQVQTALLQQQIRSTQQAQARRRRQLSVLRRVMAQYERECREQKAKDSNETSIPVLAAAVRAEMTKRNQLRTAIRQARQRQQEQVAPATESNS